MFHWFAFSIIFIDHNPRFLNMLSKEANKEDSQRSIVSLHFILHRGYSPLPTSIHLTLKQLQDN